MNALLVASPLQDWIRNIPGSRATTAQEYLTPGCRDESAARVVNLGAGTDYQSEAYYVTLLAEARGQRPLPDLATLGALTEPDLAARLTRALQAPIDAALAPLRSAATRRLICFGANADPRCRELAARLFALLPVPLLEVRFARGADGWRLAAIGCVGADAVPTAQRRFAREAAADWLGARPPGIRAPAAAIAILHEPEAAEHPSNAAALQKFVAAADQLQMRAELITRGDAGRLCRFDGLFLRATTHVNHYTYQLARQAQAHGMGVIDDPGSILHCCNKVFQAELLARHRIRQPRTMLVRRGSDDLARVIPALGLPCVLKQPDGAFSRGVVKVESAAALEAGARELLRHSALILAQEYLPTEFDWRIGILERRPLFACRYFMVPGHWQVLKNDRQTLIEGKTEALPVAAAPPAVLRTALAAANLIGDGFYGVDIKEAGGECHVMEINDNPNVDAGHEDHVLQDALYLALMAALRRRIEAARGAVRR